MNQEQGLGGARPTKRPLIGWVLLGLLIAALAIVPKLIWGPLTDTGKEFYGQRVVSAKPAADFNLTDHNGKPVRLSDFRGKVVLMSFGFTNCPDICPTTLTSLNVSAWATAHTIRMGGVVMFSGARAKVIPILSSPV